MSLALLAILVLAAVLLGLTSARLRLRARTEFRARILETLAAAVRRQAAIEPAFLWLISHDVHGRERHRVLRVAREMDDGATLSDALSTGLQLRAHIAALLASAERGGDLHGALCTAAHEQKERMEVPHRAVLALTYSAVILATLGIPLAQKYQEISDSMSGTAGGIVNAFSGTRYVLGVVLVAAVLILVWETPLVRFVRTVLVPPRRASLLVSVGWLRAFAAAVRSGVPLHDAFARSARAFDAPRHRRVAADVTDAVADGAKVDDVWHRLPTHAWLRSRAPHIGGSPQACAAVLESLAERADIERRDRAARALAVVRVSALLVTGACIGAVLLQLLLFTQATAYQAMPW